MNFEQILFNLRAAGIREDWLQYLKAMNAGLERLLEIVDEIPYPGNYAAREIRQTLENITE